MRAVREGREIEWCVCVCARVRERLNDNGTGFQGLGERWCVCV